MLDAKAEITIPLDSENGPDSIQFIGDSDGVQLNIDVDGGDSFRITVDKHLNFELVNHTTGGLVSKLNLEPKDEPKTWEPIILGPGGPELTNIVTGDIAPEMSKIQMPDFEEMDRVSVAQYFYNMIMKKWPKKKPQIRTF